MRLATSDLYESGYFLCGGARLAEVVPDGSGVSPKLVFAFDGGDELGEMQRSYHCGTATVNLAEYRRSLEALKDIMFRHIRGAQAPVSLEKREKGYRHPSKWRTRNGQDARTQQSV